MNEGENLHTYLAILPVRYGSVDAVYEQWKLHRLHRHSVEESREVRELPVRKSLDGKSKNSQDQPRWIYYFPRKEI